MLRPIPSELTGGGLLIPPALLVCVLGLIAAVICAKILNRTQLSRFIWNPPVALLAMWALFSAVIGLVLIAP